MSLWMSGFSRTQCEKACGYFLRGHGLLTGFFLLVGICLLNAQDSGWTAVEDVAVTSEEITRVGVLLENPAYEFDVNGVVNADNFYRNCQAIGIWSKNGNNLFFNSGNIGVNTTSPAHNLDVHGTFLVYSDTVSVPSLFVGQFGSVGIGTTNPSWGQLNIETNSVPIAFAEDDFSGAGSLWRLALDDGKMRFDVSQNGTDFNGYLNPLVMDSGGNVGIGKSSPQYPLDVNGTVRAGEIIVEDISGADFVFETGYVLPSLNEVAEHIRQKKHLPGIPSASQMERDGLSMGTMQIQLLQKVEELTLYVLDLNDQIIEQKKLNDELKGRIRELEKR